MTTDRHPRRGNNGLDSRPDAPAGARSLAWRAFDLAGPAGGQGACRRSRPPAPSPGHTTPSRPEAASTARWTGTFDLELCGPGGRRVGVLEVHLGLDDVVLWMAGRVQTTASRDELRRWLRERPRSHEESRVVWALSDPRLFVRLDGAGATSYPVPVENLDELASVI